MSDHIPTPISSRRHESSPQGLPADMPHDLFVAQRRRMSIEVLLTELAQNQTLGFERRR
jgi:hypothetical protein